MSANDTQVGGIHYRSKSIQPWDYMLAIMGIEGFLFFLQGTVVKYVSRYKDKGGVEDLKKARHCLDKMIEEMERC